MLDGLVDLDASVATNYCKEVLAFCRNKDELVDYVETFCEWDHVMDLFNYGFDFHESKLGNDYWKERFYYLSEKCANSDN